MNVNINHPSFISFLDNVSTSILSNVTVSNYFTLTHDKKLGVQYMVLKLMKNAVKVRVKLTDNELRSFVSVLWKKNEESENYEFASILNDIAQNFDSVNEVTKPVKRTVRKIKKDQENG
jgi:undecaprenyl pyrophosphate synthase